MSWKELEDHLLERGMSKQDIAAFRLAAIHLRAQASGRSSRSDQCPEELALSSLVDGTVQPGPRAEMIDHLASCGSCRREVAALSRLCAEPEIRRELEQLRAPEPRTTRQRLARIGGVIGAATAAAAVGLLLVPRFQAGDPTGASDHRGSVWTLSAPPLAIAPAGPVRESPRFVWTSVPRADRYELTLFDQTGVILWETRASDTLAALPDSVSLAPGTPYFWKVEAQQGFDRWSESDLVEFTLMAPSDGQRR